MSRISFYLARTILVVNLPGGVAEQDLWPLLGDAILERRLVRDPLHPGRRVAVLVYADSGRATVEAAALCLRLAGTGAAAVVLQSYLNFYAQLERAACLKGEDDSLDCSLIVANVNPNAAAIPDILGSLFSTVGHLRQQPQLNPEIGVVEFSCGSEAQTAEFAFDSLDFGGHILFAKRVHTPLYNLPSLDVQDFVWDQLRTRNKKKFSLEDTFVDVLRRFDDSHSRRKSTCSKPLSKKLFRRYHVIEKVVSKNYKGGQHKHTHKISDAVPKLVFVEQNYSSPERSHQSLEETYMQKSPLSPEPELFNYDLHMVDNFHSMALSSGKNVMVSVGNNDVAFVINPELLAMEKKIENKENEHRIPAFVCDASLSESSNKAKCLDAILDVSSNEKKNIDFQHASSHEATEQGLILYDVLKRSPDFAENPPNLDVDSVHRCLEQLDLWLKEIRGRCSVVAPSNFGTFSQYKEHVRAQIFAAYHEKLASQHSASAAAESLPVANQPDFLDLLLSRQ